jgi:hypothetical protein
MAILIVGGILLGMILGQFFKWYVLVPACGIVIVLVLVNPAYMGGFLSWFLQVVAVTTSLQIGYVVGLVSRNFQGAPKRSKDPSARSLDETLSSATETREGGKRAA